MTKNEKIKNFIKFWEDKGDEKQDTQSFWNSLLRDVLNVEKTEEIISFEKSVQTENSTKYIDGYIKPTRVLIEQKSKEKNLKNATKQSDGTSLTPYQQARRYEHYLSYDLKPKWIVTSNFKEIHIHDMNKPLNEPEIIEIKNLEKEYYRLEFLVQKENELLKKEMEVSIKAGEIVGILYDELLKQYINPKDEKTLHSLNILCVRLVFCLYAEDAEIFGKHNIFHDYLSKYDAEDLREALIKLFDVLDTKIEERDPYLKESLKIFPYVNGGLFSREEKIEIPSLNEKIKDLLLRKASEDFDWSEISPTIFGAVFESTLNPETRRSGGMHYTSIENIHKVIDPLFLNDLKKEFEEIKNISILKEKEKQLKNFQQKISSLTFLDPSCGSGNFLTESYISIRSLENEVVQLIENRQISLAIDDYTPIKVKISQFYGIEINDFAVTVAKTALWIAESQMLKKTEEIIHTKLDFLPLKTNANIVTANALKIDWNEVVSNEKLNYIMGNPPFVGARLFTENQRNDINLVFGKLKGIGNLDYVSCWYKKCAEFIQNTKINCALVSTNSITQGEQVGILWKHLMEEYKIEIDFAYRTFKWNSEASEKAKVHCVIIGFSSNKKEKEKIIFLAENSKIIAKNINPYLIDAENIFIENITKPICDVQKCGIGNKPIDGGFYLFEKEEMKEFIKKEPLAEKYFRPWIGSKEFINRNFRYCLWLGDCSPVELRKMPECLKRVEAVRNYRKTSPSIGTIKLADKPTRFHVENMPNSDYLLIPSTSSENRKYIPIGYVDKNIISSNAVLIIPDASLYLFGILTSNVHMAWVKTFCGRLKSDFRYSAGIVYNNFPFPELTEKQKEKISQTAKEILEVRKKYKDCSLADLYNDITMPMDLRKAHRENDKAVIEAYGWDWRKISETECVSKLMEMYKNLLK